MKFRVSVAVVLSIFCVAVVSVRGADIYKADNDLPLNEAASWVGGVVPGEFDVAVFDESVTTNYQEFTVSESLHWSGIVFTNTLEYQEERVGEVAIKGIGEEEPQLTLGADGVVLVGSGLDFNVKVPLVLSSAQSWLADNRRVIFNSDITGSVAWEINHAAIIDWNVVPGFSGDLSVTGNPGGYTYTRYYTAGPWANKANIAAHGRWEMRFSGSTSWSELFAERWAKGTYWVGLTSGGTVTFEEGDTFELPDGRFAIDSGAFTQSGGSVSGSEIQAQYAGNNGSYTLSGGSLELSGGVLIGNGSYGVNQLSRFLQQGGELEGNYARIGWGGTASLANSPYGRNTYELTGGDLTLGRSRNSSSGVFLSWGEGAVAPSGVSGIFLMKGGQADIAGVSLGRDRSEGQYAVTNAYSMLKLTGGELSVGRGGFYANRSWNNGVEGSGYGIKLSGGTLRASEPWISMLDMQLSDVDGGVVFNTESATEVGQRVVLNGTLYGSGMLRKSGAGTLVVAGGAEYTGGTRVDEGSLVVQAAGGEDYYCWRADAIAGESGTPVLEWLDSSLGVAAVNSNSARAPTLQRNALNGHNVVRFDRNASQYLEVAAEDSPIGGATAFSIVLVFRSGVAGNNYPGHWYSNTGLVDAEQGSIQNDWGLAYSASGQVAAGAGFPSAGRDWTIYSDSEYRVDNNKPHVVIYTWEGLELTLNVDGRVVSTEASANSVNPRNVHRMLFGSVALESSKYFHGDMAEIRIYRNRALSLAEQNLVGCELAAVYGAVEGEFEEPEILSSSGGDLSEVVVDVVPFESDAVVWRADTIAGADGASVPEWGSLGGEVVATLAGASNGSVTAPQLIRDGINGHSVVRFNGVNSGLGIAAGDSPIGGCVNFSVAFVFRTAAAVGGDNVNWYNSTGIIDAEQPGRDYDWGLGISGQGYIMAGIGQTDVTSLSRIHDLYDGEPHAVVVAYDGDGGLTRIMVDGFDVEHSVGVHSTPRNIYRIIIGSMNAAGGKFFNGDLAEFLLLPDEALSMGEMRQLNDELCARYAIYQVPRINTLTPAATGLGSGDIEVKAGANLVLPSGVERPLSLRQGQRIRGGGSVIGRLAVADGGVAEIGSEGALSVEYLSFGSGGVLEWSSGEPEVVEVMEVDQLEVDGGVVVRVTGGGELPSRVNLIEFNDYVSGEFAEWSVEGALPSSRVVIDMERGRVDLVTPSGTLMIIK